MRFTIARLATGDYVLADPRTRPGKPTFSVLSTEELNRALREAQTGDPGFTVEVMPDDLEDALSVSLP